MEVKRQDLLKALKSVRPGLATRALIEQSTSFAFIKGTVVTYNDAVSIRYPLPDLEDLTGAVSADELYHFVNRSTQDITLEDKGNELLVRSGRARAGLKLTAEIKLPLDETKIEGKWADTPKDFSSGIKMTLYSCSKDASMPALTCIHVHNDTMVSSDRIRLTRYKCETPMKGVDLLLSSVAAKELLAYEIKQYSVGKSWVHFKVEGDAIFSCRLVEVTFPSTDKLFDVSGESIILPKRLIDVLEKAGVFSKREHDLDQEVEISLQDRRMLVKAQSDFGWFQEEVGIKYEGPTLDFSAHPGFLKEACERETTCTISSTRMKFSSDKWEHVLALKA